MGFYIETPKSYDKAADIVAGKAMDTGGTYSARILESQPEWETIDHDKFGVVVVIDNGLFEAAGHAYSKDEFNVFTDPRDRRRKQFLLMDKDACEMASGYYRTRGPMQ